MRQSGYEIAAYAVVPLLLIAAGAMPSVAAFLLPAILPLLYLLFRRFGAVFPLTCVSMYGLLSLTLNYDVLTVLYFCFLIFALCGLILSAQLNHYLLCAAVCVGVAILGGFAGLTVIRVAEGKPLAAVAADYIVAEREDPFVAFLAENRYDGANIPADIGKLSPGDEGYYDAVTEYYSEYAHDDIETYGPYYCLHYSAIFAMLAYFVSVIIGRNTASAYDYDIGEPDIRLSTRCLGGIRRESVAIRDMKFPRSYLWAVLLPGLLTSIVLDIVGGYMGLSATVMHAFVTLPSAHAFVTLMAFFASQFNGKARIAAYSVFFVLMAAMMLVPMILFICSIIGLCDVILNLRYWTNFLRSDD